MITPEVTAALELEKNGHSDKAIAYLYTKSKEAPSNIGNWLHLALIAARNGKFDVAINCTELLSRNKIRYHQSDLGILPKKTILFPQLDWFFQDTFEIYNKLAKKGLYPVIIHYQIENRIPLPDLTPDNFKDYKYKEISFYDGVMYGSANILRKAVADINPQDPEHWQVLVDHMETMAGYAEYVSKMIDFARPEKVVYPQGYIFYAYVLKQVAIAKGIPCLALEYTMNSNQVLYETVSGISVNKNTVRNTYWRMKDLITKEQATAYKDDFFTNIKNLKQDEHKIAEETITLPDNPDNKKTVLYLGQVGLDSSVLMGIRNFKNQADVIREAVKAVLDNGQRIVLKFHPKEKDGMISLFNCRICPEDLHINHITLEWLKQDEEFAPYFNHPDVIIDTDNTYNTYDLIDKSDFCITINSQAGLEALMRGKQVILCGYSFYGGMGWTSDAHDAQDLAYLIQKHCAMETPKTPEPNPEVLKFFYSFMNYSCFTKTLDNYLKIMTEG